MTDRSKAPIIYTDFDLTLSGIEETVFDNGCKLVCIPAKGSEIIKLDIILHAGRFQETKPAQSRMAFSTLFEGSSKITANDFNEKMDYYGALISSKAGLDVSTISLVCLKKYFPIVFPSWIEMIRTAQFPEKEIEIKKEITIQNLERQLAKNNVVSYRELSSNIFGVDTAYGYNTQKNDILQIDSNDLNTYHQEAINFTNAQIVLSGDVDDRAIQLIEKNILQYISKPLKSPNYFTQNFVPEKKYIAGPQKNQVSIRLGRKLFAKGHPDFFAIEILNIALGGFFGSRLVSNIREDKGFCYHIDSTLDSMLYDGCMYISADVGNDHVSDTIREIHNELHLISEEKISDAELKMIKNYLKGQLLGLLDGPFAKASLVKNYLLSGQDYKSFKDFPEFITDVNAEILRDTANKYLKPEFFSVYVVGKTD